jgi:hypothetical protein
MSDMIPTSTEWCIRVAARDLHPDRSSGRVVGSLDVFMNRSLIAHSQGYEEYFTESLDCIVAQMFKLIRTACRVPVLQQCIEHFFLESWHRLRSFDSRSSEKTEVETVRLRIKLLFVG